MFSLPSLCAPCASGLPHEATDLGDTTSSIPAPSTSSGTGWQSGLFDRGSWVESHAGWARTVVTGRARLGGQAVGVIAGETQPVLRHLPADPGMPDSAEQNIPQVSAALHRGGTL